MVLAESVPDIDKVLLGLEGKDFTVEKSTLQSLQQLIQFIADLSLNILARLPENRSMGGGTTSRNTGVRANFSMKENVKKNLKFNFSMRLAKTLLP